MRWTIRACSLNEARDPVISWRAATDTACVQYLEAAHLCTMVQLQRASFAVSPLKERELEMRPNGDGGIALLRHPSSTLPRTFGPVDSYTQQPPSPPSYDIRHQVNVDKAFVANKKLNRG
jgi:hypothetical protein